MKFLQHENYVNELLAYIGCMKSFNGSLDPTRNSIPNTLVQLEALDCGYTGVASIPETLVNLRYLECDYTPVTSIPKTLINLEYVQARKGQLVSLPATAEQNYIPIPRFELGILHSKCRVITTSLYRMLLIGNWRTIIS